MFARFGLLAAVLEAGFLGQLLLLAGLGLSYSYLKPPPAIGTLNTTFVIPLKNGSPLYV